jgi:hypothetical protein
MSPLWVLPLLVLALGVVAVAVATRALAAEAASLRVAVADAAGLRDQVDAFRADLDTARRAAAGVGDLAARARALRPALPTSVRPTGDRAHRRPC